MQFRVAARTDVGRRREHNEDSYLVELPLIAIADGMGGAVAGEVASQLALEVLAEWRERLESEGSLRDAVLEANRAVWSRSREDSNLRGMGTTLTSAWLDGEQATIAHVGDSRAYLLRGGSLQQLTEDQTVVSQLQREGEITPDEAAVHPRRHMLLQAVGTEPRVDVDVTLVELKPGDRLLLASDGLHDMVDEPRIADILGGHDDPDEACRELVEAANEAGGVDNVTVILLDAVVDGAPTAAGPDDQIIVSKPSAARSGRPSLTRIATYAGAGLAIVVVAVAVLWVMNSAQRQLMVSTDPDARHVAIVRGVPGRESGPAADIKEVIREYPNKPVAQLAARDRRSLRAGIPVATLAEAQRTVATLQPPLGLDATPRPTSAPRPTPQPTVATSIPQVPSP